MKVKVTLPLLLALLGVIACGDSEGDTGAGGAGGSTTAVCDGYNDCHDLLVEHIDALACAPDTAIAFVPPMQCVPAYQEFIICAARDTASVTCDANDDWAFACGVCSDERAALDAACGGQLPCE